MSLGPYKHKFTALWALYKNTPSRLLRYFRLNLSNYVVVLSDIEQPAAAPDHPSGDVKVACV